MQNFGRTGQFDDTILTFLQMHTTRFTLSTV